MKLFFHRITLAITTLCVFSSTLAISDDNEKIAILRGGKISITGEINEPKLLLNGKKLLEPGSFGLSIVKTFSIGEKDVVLVMNNSGGTACPVQYFFVAVTPQGSAMLSPEFGTCSYYARPKQSGSSIYVTMPKMAGRGNAKYIYSNGSITENGKPINDISVSSPVDKHSGLINGKKMKGDQLDKEPGAKPNGSTEAKNKKNGKTWQDYNGFMHYPDGSASNGPVD